MTLSAGTIGRGGPGSAGPSAPGPAGWTSLAARWIGGTSGLAVAILWPMVVAWAPEVRGVGPPAWVAAAVFATLGASATVAAWRNQPLVLALTGFLSFVPVGFYLSFTPGVLHWLGWLDLAILVSGIVLVRNLVRGAGRGGDGAA